MSWRVTWTKAATKQLLSIEKKQRLLILAWVDKHLEGCENPKADYSGQRMQGKEDLWRYRVGSYRVLARLHEGELIVEVVRVGHRQGVYGNLPER